MGNIYGSSCVTLPQVDIYAVFDGSDADAHLVVDYKYSIYDKDMN